MSTTSPYPRSSCHSLFTGKPGALMDWLKISPRNCITVLDTHDGIGIIDAGPDKAAPGSVGLLGAGELDSLVETIHDRTDGVSRRTTGLGANNLDIYQVNSTYYDALGGDDTDYIVARAIQFFCPGIPQVYYVGLLAGRNDEILFDKTQVGRDINRHYYSTEEIDQMLERPVVQAPAGP